MEAVFGCTSTSDCQEKGVHHVASLNNSDIFPCNRAEAKVKLQTLCSYSLYDHSQELQKNGAKLASSHFYCRGCKITVMKENPSKCQTCGTAISSSQSWLLAALAGGFHGMRGEKSHIISRTTDSKMMAEDWLNDCLESMLTLLARGEPFSHGSDSEGTPVTSDYLEAVSKLDQEDIRLLMPEPRGLHSFCGESCISMDIYDESHLLRTKL